MRVAAHLVLEDGTAFSGFRFGAESDAFGEVVFNTSMVGYQEILTDPSYAGQVVVMTYPMIGNYGINREDLESRRPYLAGFVVKELSRVASNWRHAQSLPAYLAETGVAGLYGIDTRALVRHLRERGAMRGTINGDPGVATLEKVRAHPSMAGLDLASRVTHPEAYDWQQPSLGSTAPKALYNVVAMDFGIKWSILRRLVDVGCSVRVVPAQTSAEAILALKPDGVLLSNGPGDPEPVTYAVATIRKLLGRVPILGICLGHQLLGIAAGAKTYKLRFGHRGGNHPVMDMADRTVAITSHNHGFAVDADHLPGRIEITHVNLNDQTVEGLRLKDVPAFAVQYHPEAAPGPHDAGSVFDRFAALMHDWRRP